MNELGAIFYQHPNNGGASFKMGANTTVGQFPSYMEDQASWIVTHPATTVQVCDHRYMSSNGKCVNYTGTINMDRMNADGTNDHISSARTTSHMTQDEWKRNCCRQQTTAYTSSSKCGSLWNGTDCDNSGCTPETLTTDPYCVGWCRDNPSRCDSLKIQFCQQHPTDPLCGCINDTPAAIAERRRYPTVVANRPCWPNSDCQKTDLVNTLIPTSISNMPCPTDITSQMMIAEAGGTIIGASQTANSGGGSGAPTMNFTDDMMFIYIMLFIIIITVVVIITIIIII